MHLSPGHIKFVLILSLLHEFNLKRQSHILKSYFQTDLQSCNDCFAFQQSNCLQLYESFVEPTDLAKLVKAVSFFCDRRHIYWLQLSHSNESLLAKRRTSSGANVSRVSNVHALQQQFLAAAQRPGQFQLCTEQLNANTTPRFVAYFEQRGYSPLTIWYYMTENITPLLMHELWALHFPVPRSYGSCGLTYFQAYAGRTLIEFRRANFNLRLMLAKQLLELALTMTIGFDNFRIYITDFTAYNFAYNEMTHQLTLIDLDTIVVVDASIKMLESVKYMPLPGEGFTYDVAALCAGQLSDANVYQACSLLSEFLLHDLDEQHAELHALLDDCVMCLDDLCDLRFQYAYDLIKLLKQMQEQYLEVHK